MPLLTIPTGNVASAIGGGYDVANSVRFNDDDSAYMYINPSSSGNPDKWTYSCWIKRTTLGAWQIFFSAGTDTNNRFEISFESDDKILIMILIIIH